MYTIKGDRGEVRNSRTGKNLKEILQRGKGSKTEVGHPFTRSSGGRRGKGTLGGEPMGGVDVL